MGLTAAQIDQQKKQAEELLFSGPQKQSFAKGLFFGQFNASLLFPYPSLRSEEEFVTRQSLAEVREFCESSIDATAIDRDALIPPSVISGLSRIGVLGMTARHNLAGETSRNWPTPA
jgi:hypothetical protein